MPGSLRNLLAIIALLAFLQNAAQEPKPTVSIKHTRQMLMGRWQLVQTFAEGKSHEVRKEEYDCVISLKKHHIYSEEVLYESNHWKIEGKWTMVNKTASLILTDRHYIIGPGEKLHDITFQIPELTCTQWTGISNANSQIIKMYYHKLANRH